MKKINIIILAVSIIIISCIFISILYPSIYSSRSFRNTYVYLCFYIIADSFFIIALLSILKIFSMAIFKKFILYISIAVAGSALISFLLFAAYQLLIEKNCIRSGTLLPYMIIESVLLVFFNFIISKIIFSLKITNAIFIGTIIGLINAFIGMPPICC